jgi:hypothetical protein
VLEVKVNERIPHFMVTLLARHECVLTRMSKYCAVVSHEQAAWAGPWREERMSHG